MIYSRMLYVYAMDPPQLYTDSGGLFAITIYVARNRRPVCMISTAIITTVLRIKDRFIVIPNSGQGQEV